jgi:hypothetical protein
MKIKYFVNYGQTPSHLFECRVFDRLNEAKSFIETLPKNCLGNPMPFELKRMEFKTNYSNI